MSRAKRFSFSLFNIEWGYDEEPEPLRESDLSSQIERLPEEEEMEGNVKERRGLGFAMNDTKRTID